MNPWTDGPLLSRPYRPPPAPPTTEPTIPVSAPDSDHAAHAAPPPSGATSVPHRLWIDGPWVDLLVGCGGWSLPLLLVSYLLVDRDVSRWSTAFYALALAFNYPHYMATIYRAYGREDRGQHRLFTHYLTAALVLIGVAAHVRFALVPWLFTAYVMWSPWHYTGQNFGLVMMFLRRAGLDVSRVERRQLHVAFIASFVMLLAAFNQGPSHDPLVLSLGLPVLVARAIQAVAALVFVVAGGLALVSLGRRAPRGALLAPLTLCSTQALWFVVPTAVSWASPLAVPQTRYSSGMLALMHSAQYLWVTQYFARRDAESGSLTATWNARAYWATLLAGGIALFLPVPWLASYVWHADFTASVFIVAAVVNIHHFMIDGVVWKLRSPRVSQLLVKATDRPAAPHGAPGRMPAPTPARRPTLGVSWRVAALVMLVGLAALDQWRYVLAVGHTDREGLALAARLNPFDSGANLRLAQAASHAGDVRETETALRQAVAASPQNPVPARALVRQLVEWQRFGDAYKACQSLLAQWPGDADMLVNAGVLAYRLGDQEAAIRWWNQALAVNGSQFRVHLYLAELLNARGRSADALPHYQAYLEQVTTTSLDARPAPGEIVPAVIKFADALAANGRTAAAATQYDVAARMARQTGLVDLERIARQRLTPPSP